jgi:hypothetical protein
MNLNIENEILEEEITIISDEKEMVETEEVVEIDIVEDPEVEVEIVEIPEEELMEDDVLVEDIDINTFFKIGDAVKLVPGAKFAAGGNIPANLFNTKLYVRDIKDGRYSIGIRTTGRIAGSVHPSSIRAYGESVSLIDEEPFETYYISVNENSLDVKSKPTNNSKTLKTIYADDLYTVVGEKNGWGHLKIGGWIPLDQTHIVTPIKI